MLAAAPSDDLASCRNWCSFWTLGTINNFAYVVILCGAANLANSFNDGNLTGMVSWANVMIGIGARSLNMACLSIPTNKRFIFAAVVFSLSYAALALSVRVSFFVSIVSIVVIGGACSVGESIILGYLKNYPASVTGGWSSGTGMAGVGGSLYYLLLWLLLHEQRKMTCTDSLLVIFASLVPLSLIYLLVFMFAPTRPDGMKGGRTCVDRDEEERDAQRTMIPNDSIVDHNGGGAAARAATAPLLLNDPVYTNNTNNTNTPPLSTTTPPTTPEEVTEPLCARIVRLGRSVLLTSVQLLLVYFFEYVVSVAFAIHSPSYALNGSWWCSNGYTVLQFCYQSGVLLSRSSLRCLRIKRISYLTFLQLINFIGWFLQAKYHFLSVSLQVVWMIWVGCMGGAMYVNVFANLVDDTEIAEKDRELSINLVAMAMNGGIVMSALFQLLAENTFLSGPSACAADTRAQCGSNVTTTTAGLFPTFVVAKAR